MGGMTGVAPPPSAGFSHMQQCVERTSYNRVAGDSQIGISMSFADCPC